MTSHPSFDNFEAHKPEVEQAHEQLLDSMCDQLYPTTGFSLTLEGIQPATPVRKEIEALTKTELSATRGATIELAYDITTNSLELESIHHPLQGCVDAKLSIMRTKSEHEALRYIPVLDFGHTQYELNKVLRHPSIFKSHLQTILAGYGIAEIPHPSHESYQLWRANLLSDCQEGWKSTEKVTLLTGFSDHAEETITITNSVLYNDDGSALSTKELTFSNLYSRADSETTQEVITALTKESDLDGEHLHARKDVITKEADEFVLNSEIVTNSHRKDIPINDASLSLFQRIGTEAEAFLKARQ